MMHEARMGCADQVAAVATPLIISGAPRSGTSLLYNLFDGHPDVSFLLIEGYLFEKIFDIGLDNSDLFVAAARRSVADFIAGVRDHHLMPPLEQPYQQSLSLGTVSSHCLDIAWNEERFRESLATRLAGLETVADLWRLLVDAYMAGMGAPVRRYACLKSPDYGKSTLAAVHTIAAARGIVILRDPLLALDSLKRSRELRGEKKLTWPEFARCVAEMKAMLERLEKAPGEAVRWVRYERLVEDPDSVMRELAAWLEIEFDPCLLEPTMLSQAWPGISSFAATSGVDTGPARRTTQALDDDELSLARGAFEAFGSFGFEVSA